MPIIIVSAIDMNNGIGDADGNLLYNLPKDMKFFKSLTTGKHVVMGRKTWESLPTKPLPKRKNYILTMNEEYEAYGAKILHHTDEVHELAKSTDVYIIGGAEIYYQFIDDADELIITHVHDLHSDAKAHFPDFGYKEFEIVGEPIKHEADDQHEQSFSFTRYKRK